jgi:hypothetical protein
MPDVKNIAARLRMVYREQGVQGAYRRVQQAVAHHYREWVAGVMGRYPAFDELATQSVVVEDTVEVPLAFGAPHDELPARFRRLGASITAPARVVYDVADATVCGGRPVVGVNGYRVKLDVIGTGGFPYDVEAEDLDSGASAKMNETHAYVVGGARRSFPMWFYEQLPKVFWYERYVEQSGTQPRLVCVGPLHPFMHQTLALLGYDEASYDVIDPGEQVTYRRLSLPPHPMRNRGGEMQVCPRALQWIAQRMRERLQVKGNDLPKRIYISRADAERRKVRNEREVRAALEARGFHTVELSRLPLTLQFAFFRAPEYVVGPHGAGLVHLLHGTGARVCEWHRQDGISAHYALLANERGHQYSYLLCEESRKATAHARFRSMHVPVERLTASL